MSKETTKTSPLEKIKCFRVSDNKEIWLNPKLAYNKARQRQMGFFPENPEGPAVEPSEEENIDVQSSNGQSEKPNADAGGGDDSPELDGLDDDDNGDDDVNDSSDQSQDDTPPAGEPVEDAASDTPGDQDVADENQDSSSAEEPKPLSKAMQNLHNLYKEKFGSFPPSKWKQKTIKKKLNG